MAMSRSQRRVQQTRMDVGKPVGRTMSELCSGPVTGRGQQVRVGGV